MAHTKTTPLVLAAGLSMGSLLLISGCASSPARSQADNSSGVAQWNQVQSQSQRATQSASVDPGNELVIGAAFSDESVPVYRDPISSYTMSEIRSELEAMSDLDQTLVRESMGVHAHDQSTVAMIHAIDRAHSDRLKEIVDHIGWPTREMVGFKATQSAYMVIQHAGHDIDFQNRCLAMMVDLVEQGELPASYVALLTDRIRLFQNQPQVFGTQMAMKRDEFGIIVPTPSVPIEDPDHLDERRALMGMPPFHEFVSAISIAYEASKVDPGNAFAEVPTESD